MRLPIVLLLAAAAVAGCGGEQEEASPPPTVRPPAETGSETLPPPETTELRVYFLRDGRIAAASREVERTPAVARAALEALLEGPTAREREVGLETNVPAAVEVESLRVEDGTAHLDLSGTCVPMAQIVYTLTQFRTVERVDSTCLAAPAGRADFEDVTPAILVESPTLDEEVTSPLRITGTANTFEATFMINVVDWDGRIVTEQFATATSGSGERGTFDVTVPFEIDRPGGALIVFEASAEDGRPVHVVEIPLQLQP